MINYTLFKFVLGIFIYFLTKKQILYLRLFKKISNGPVFKKKLSIIKLRHLNNKILRIIVQRLKWEKISFPLKKKRKKNVVLKHIIME